MPLERALHVASAATPESPPDRSIDASSPDGTLIGLHCSFIVHSLFMNLSLPLSTGLMRDVSERKKRSQKKRKTQKAGGTEDQGGGSRLAAQTPQRSTVLFPSRSETPNALGAVAAAAAAAAAAARELLPVLPCVPPLCAPAAQSAFALRKQQPGALQPGALQPNALQPNAVRPTQLLLARSTETEGSEESGGHIMASWPAISVYAAVCILLTVLATWICRRRRNGRKGLRCRKLSCSPEMSWPKISWLKLSLPKLSCRLWTPCGRLDLRCHKKSAPEESRREWITRMLAK